MPLPARLVLLGAAVVVDGEQHRAALLRRGAEVDGGLAAVAADLEQRPVDASTTGRGVVQREPFVGRHEAPCRLGGAAEPGVHFLAVYQLSTWTMVSRSMRGPGLKSVPLV